VPQGPRSRWRCRPRHCRVSGAVGSPDRAGWRASRPASRLVVAGRSPATPWHRAEALVPSPVPKPDHGHQDVQRIRPVQVEPFLPGCALTAPAESARTRRSATCIGVCGEHGVGSPELFRALKVRTAAARRPAARRPAARRPAARRPAARRRRGGAGNGGTRWISTVSRETNAPTIAAAIGGAGSGPVRKSGGGKLAFGKDASATDRVSETPMESRSWAADHRRSRSSDAPSPKNPVTAPTPSPFRYETPSILRVHDRATPVARFPGARSPEPGARSPFHVKPPASPAVRVETPPGAGPPAVPANPREPPRGPAGTAERSNVKAGGRLSRGRAGWPGAR
jgi:hypothetical protein